MQCSPNRNDPTPPRRKPRMVVDQQDKSPPSRTFSPSRRRRRTLVSRRSAGGKLMWSGSQSPQDVSSPPTTLLQENDQFLREGSALLDLCSFPFPELLVAPDDDEQTLRAARRWDMLKDDMLMFYRELYKLQVKESCGTLSSSAPDSTSCPAHEDKIEEKDEQQDDVDDQEGDTDEVPINNLKKTWEKKFDDQRDKRSRLCSRGRALM